MPFWNCGGCCLLLIIGPIQFRFPLFQMKRQNDDPVSLRAWRKQRARIGRPLMWALMIQAGVLMLTVFVVVFVPTERKEPEFVAHKTIYLPQREIEHQVALSAFEQVASPSLIMERITVDALSAHGLPDLPDVADQAFQPMMTPDMLPPSAQLPGVAGLAGMAAGLGKQASNLSFFGVSDQGERVVIAFDVSQSVIDKASRAGVPVGKIKEETARLIDSLNAHTTFSVVQFIRRYEVFSAEMIPATVANKRKALEWLDHSFYTRGVSPAHWTRVESEQGKPVLDGVQAVMEMVFEWEPDVVFILSDGGFGRNYPKRCSEVDLDELARDIARLQERSPERARIHFIGFEMKPKREAGVQSIVRQSGGTFKTF